MTDKKGSQLVAMTGEITLQGRVLPIGGLKEKLLSALRGGIKTVIIPKDNEKDLEEIPDNVKTGLKIIPVSEVSQVIDIVLKEKVKPLVQKQRVKCSGMCCFIHVVQKFLCSMCLYQILTIRTS